MDAFTLAAAAAAVAAALVVVWIALRSSKLENAPAAREAAVSGAKLPPAQLAREYEAQRATHEAKIAGETCAAVSREKSAVDIESGIPVAAVPVGTGAAENALNRLTGVDRSRVNSAVMSAAALRTAEQSAVLGEPAPIMDWTEAMIVTQVTPEQRARQRDFGRECAPYSMTSTAVDNIEEAAVLSATRGWGLTAFRPNAAPQSENTLFITEVGPCEVKRELGRGKKGNPFVFQG